MAVQHLGPRICITGIPTAGKSTLAQNIADETNGIVLATDVIRKELVTNPIYEPWVNFYREKDPYEYYTNTNPKEQWKTLYDQSVNIWPGILEVINHYKDEQKLVIVEGVSALPELIHRDLGWPCLVLVNNSLEETHRRNKIKPRWGIKDPETLLLNSKGFYSIEGPEYIKQAKEFGYPVFDNNEAARKYILKTL